MQSNYSINHQNQPAGADGLARLSQQLVLVQHGIELWSGQAKITDGDYNVAGGGTLLKEDVKASSGQKWLIDKSTLAPFLASKKRFITILESTGLRFMGGYAVPADRWQEIRSQLEEEIETFEELKHDFLAKYEANVRDWARSHPKLELSICTSAPTRDEVEVRIRSGYMAVRLSPVTESDAPMLEEKLSGLTGQLVLEVASAARTFVRSVLGRSTDGRSITSVKQIAILAAKLRGLAFIAPGCLPFAQLIDRELQSLKNARGTLDRANPQVFLKLVALTGILTDEKILAEILGGKLSMDEVRTRLAPLSQVSQGSQVSQVSQASPVSPFSPVPLLSTPSQGEAEETVETEDEAGELPGLHGAREGSDGVNEVEEVNEGNEGSDGHEGYDLHEPSLFTMPSMTPTTSTTTPTSTSTSVPLPPTLPHATSHGEGSGMGNGVVNEVGSGFRATNAGAGAGAGVGAGYGYDDFAAELEFEAAFARSEESREESSEERLSAKEGVVEPQTDAQTHAQPRPQPKPQVHLHPHHHVQSSAESFEESAAESEDEGGVGVGAEVQASNASDSSNASNLSNASNASDSTAKPSSPVMGREESNPVEEKEEEDAVKDEENDEENGKEPDAPAEVRAPATQYRAWF